MLKTPVQETNIIPRDIPFGIEESSGSGFSSRYPKDNKSSATEILDVSLNEPEKKTTSECLPDATCQDIKVLELPKDEIEEKTSSVKNVKPKRKRRKKKKKQIIKEAGNAGTPTAVFIMLNRLRFQWLLISCVIFFCLFTHTIATPIPPIDVEWETQLFCGYNLTKQDLVIKKNLEYFCSLQQNFEESCRLPSMSCPNSSSACLVNASCLLLVTRISNTIWHLEYGIGMGSVGKSAKGEHGGPFTSKEDALAKYRNMITTTPSSATVGVDKTDHPLPPWARVAIIVAVIGGFISIFYYLYKRRHSRHRSSSFSNVRISEEEVGTEQREAGETHQEADGDHTLSNGDVVHEDENVEDSSKVNNAEQMVNGHGPLAEFIGNGMADIEATPSDLLLGPCSNSQDQGQNA